MRVTGQLLVHQSTRGGLRQLPYVLPAESRAMFAVTRLAS